MPIIALKLTHHGLYVTFIQKWVKNGVIFFLRLVTVEVLTRPAQICPKSTLFHFYARELAY